MLHLYSSGPPKEVEVKMDSCATKKEDDFLSESNEATSLRSDLKGDIPVVGDELIGDGMEMAMKLAQQALAVGEVPVGCVFVFESKIIAIGRNTVNETRNATRHAEINCIDDVCLSMFFWLNYHP